LILVIQAVPWAQAVSRRSLIAEDRFNPRSFQVRFVVDKVELGQISFRAPVLPYSPVCIIPPMFSSRLHLYIALTRRT